MTQCTAKPLAFSSLSRRRVEADFDGGHLTSDGGALLLREVDRRLRLTERLAACLTDRRDPEATTHPVEAMLRQRLFGIALGYEDLNDHQTLRDDPLMKVLAERPPEAAGYLPHIRRIGEEKLDAKRRKRRPARRWVVERTLAWLSKCRAILVRYAKKACNYLGLIKLACVLLWFRRLHRLEGVLR